MTHYPRRSEEADSTSCNGANMPPCTLESYAEAKALPAGFLRRLREEHRALLQDEGLGLNGLRLLDFLFQRPLVNVNLVRDSLGGSS